MKTLKILLGLFTAIAMIGGMARDLYAETRTLTTMIVITVKAPQTQTTQVPNGLEELYNMASQNQRMIKVEEPINTPSGLPRYTMTERL